MMAANLATATDPSPIGAARPSMTVPVQAATQIAAEAGAQAGGYKEAILFLVTAGVVVPLFHRLRVSPVLGFIGAGALLGPFGLGRFSETHPWLGLVTIASRSEIAHLAEFGVIFLMFMIGVELSWERLRVLRRLVFGLGSIQVIVSAAMIAAILVALDQPVAGAVLVGLALALSSTAVVLPVLAEQKRLGTPAGRTSFAVLLFQDLAVAPILFAIAVLGRNDGGNLGAALALALGQAAVALALIVVAGRVALRPLFHLVALTRSPELFMAACLLVIVATAPFLVPYAHIRGRELGLRSTAEVSRFSADVYSYATAFGDQRVWGRAMRAFPKSEGELFPGVVPVLLAAIGIAAGLWSREPVTAAGTPRRHLSPD